MTIVGDPVFGGDIGFELSTAFTAVTYPIFRYIERKYENPERFRRREKEEGGIFYH